MANAKNSDHDHNGGAISGSVDSARRCSVSFTEQLSKTKRRCFTGQRDLCGRRSAALHVPWREPSGSLSNGCSTLSAFMLKNNGEIALSATHLAIHPDGKAINEVLSFTISPNNFVELRNVFVDPLTYHSDKVDIFDCQLGEGIALGW